MKNSIRNFLCVLAIASLMLLTLPLETPSESSGETFEWHGVLCPTVIRSDGSVEEMDCNHNLITTAGKNHIRAALGNAEVGANAFNYQAVGNGSTPSAGDTTLDSEIGDCGLSRAGGTYVAEATAGNWSQQYQWTSTCNDLIVNTTALLNNTSGGTLLAAGAFSSSVTLQSGDKLNVTYYTWVS